MNNLRLIGVKTLLIMMADLLLAWVGLFSGILSALAFNVEPWGRDFWLWTMLCGVSASGTLIISWWCWIQLKYNQTR